MIDTQYKSFEQKHLPLFGDIWNGLWSSVKGFYTLPTTARKFISGQNILQRYIDNGNWSKTAALGAGLAAGTLLDVKDLGNFSFSDLPLYFWAATNVASAIYEAKNLDKTRKNIARLVDEGQ